MKKQFLVFSILICFSCSPIDKPPRYLINEQNMRDILINIHLAEGKIALINLPEDSSRIIFNKLSTEIFKKFKVSDSTFKASYNYYSEFEGSKLEKIYASVVDSLSLREARKNIY